MSEQMYNSQLELFGGQKQDAVSPSISRSFVAYIWQYEKVILLIIGFLITGIVAFCLGVEKGRRMAAVQINQPFDTASRKQQNTLVNTAAVANPVVVRPVATTPAATTNQDAFTIQIASYQTRSAAEREMVSLKKKGLEALVLDKGNYIILCVGSFTNKENARTILAQLKTKYRDCYIRRL